LDMRRANNLDNRQGMYCVYWFKAEWIILWIFIFD